MDNNIEQAYVTRNRYRNKEHQLPINILQQVQFFVHTGRLEL